MFAVAAIGRQARDHMVARFYRAHVATHLFDYPRRLVTQYHGGRVRIGPVDEVQIRVAYANGNSPYQYLTWAGLADSDLFNGQWGARGMEYGSFHIVVLYWKQRERHDGSAALFQRLISEMIIWRTAAL
ncbi:hypothetical protein D3C84_643530 [compost metagenome]